MATCVFILAIPSLEKVSDSFTLQLAALIGALALYTITLAAHLQGYVNLGRMYNSTLLSRSTQFVIAGVLFFGSTVITNIFVQYTFDPIKIEVANTAVGFAATLLLIPWILFMIATFRLYKTLGIWMIVAVCITPLAVLFIWKPWLVILTIALSTYFFYRASRSNGARLFSSYR